MSALAGLAGLDGLGVDAAETDTEERWRRTALVLHGLAPGDRDWLLGRLPEGQVLRLRSLLSELAELGLPGDASLVRSALSGGAPVGAGGASSHPVLAAADAATVYECLGSEPDEYVAAVLAAQRWDWADELLVFLGQRRAERVRSLSSGRSARLPAALRDAVLQALANRIEARSGSPARALPRRTRAHRHHGWLHWIRKAWA